MESGIQSSFIPQDAAAGTSYARRYDGGGLSDLLVLAAVVFFVASAALGGAVFLYKQYLTASTASKLDQLKRAQQEFQPALLQQIIRLDDRMQMADAVLSQHIAPTVLFQALEQSTLSTVSFTSLDFGSTDPEHMTIKMSGVAKDVNSIALQADVLSKSGVITNPIFSGIDRQKDGVHFQLNATVNQNALNYVSLVRSLLSQQQQQQTPPVGAEGSTSQLPQTQPQTPTPTQTQTQAQTQPQRQTQVQNSQTVQPESSQSGSPFLPQGQQ